MLERFDGVERGVNEEESDDEVVAVGSFRVFERQEILLGEHECVSEPRYDVWKCYLAKQRVSCTLVREPASVWLEDMLASALCVPPREEEP